MASHPIFHAMVWVVLYLRPCYAVLWPRNSTQKLPTFGDTVQVFGAMARTDQHFQDGLAIDLFSPKNRTLTVQQNFYPLPAQYVTGTTGAPWIALSNYSYIVKMNERANDLIAKIELPWNPSKLKRLNVLQANTYVAKRANNSWVIDDTTRNVHKSENMTRIMKMTSIDGEYMLIGRQTLDTANIYMQYGYGRTRTVNMTGGPGLQEAEFIDGLRFSAEAPSAMSMNVVLKPGVNPGTLPPGTQSLNTYMWVLNTSDPKVQLNAEMLVPFNRNLLVALRPAGSSPTTMLTVGKRALNATSGQFLPLNATQVVHELPEDRIYVSGLTQLDGQYIILVTSPQQPTTPAP